MKEEIICEKSFDLNEVKSYCSYTGIAVQNSHDNTIYYGCLFSNCMFNNIEMTSDDIIGCLYTNCFLNAINLSNTDFSTNKLTETKLDKVIFDGATISNCDFGKCVFETCTFNHILLSNTVFRNCNFTNIDFIHTTTCNNQFIECTFTNCDLKNSVNYNIFNDCKFTKTNIDINVFVSNIFNIKKKEEFPYIIDGNPIDVMQHLEDTSQYIHCAISLFNMAYMTLDGAFLKSIKSIEKCCMSKLIVRVEQIVFVDTLLKYSTATNNFISALTLFQCINTLKPLLSEKAGINENYVQSVCIAIKQLYLDCCELYSKMLNKEDKIRAISNNDKLYLNIIYENKPQYDLSTLLNSIASYNHIEEAHASCVLGEYACYHEIIEFTLQMLPVINTLATLLGLLIPFKIHRMNKKEKDKHESSNKTESKILNNYNIYNTIQVNTNNNIYNTEIIQKFDSTAFFLLKNNITCENKYCGYNNENIRTIIVQDDFYENK